MTTDDSIPPTPPTPEKRKPGRPRKDAAPAPVARKRIDPAALMPDLDSMREVITEHYYYWVGALPDCPVECVTLGGEAFPKLTEDLVRERDNQTGRIPRIGSLVRLTRQKLERIADRLSRTVIRFTNDAGEVEEPGTGQNLGDLHRRPRKGFLITIPTAEEVKLRDEKGLPSRRYTQQPNDRPVAQYLFCHLCPDQTKGSRGDHYPQPISVSGLEWPGSEE